MRWRGRQQSDNVQDRRGMSPQRLVGGGGGALLLIGIMVLGRMAGCNPEQIQQAVNVANQVQQQRQAAPVEVPAGNEAGIDDEYRAFISVVLNDTEEVWSRLFREQVNGDYAEPQLILFTGQTQTGCGPGQAAMGPFYCPADQKVYIDPTFFEDLARRHQAPGDFAQAYVIAHEVAHHVQNLTGLNRKLNQLRRSGNKQEVNRASVRLELQADFLAGVWAHHAHRQFDILEAGDMEEAIQAANQIGDDTLQKQAQGYTIPERYTHGTSAQRVRWFRQGMKSGKLNDCLLLAELPYDEL